RGHKFSTYAAWWIHQAMIRAVQKHSRTVRAPSHVYDLQLRFKRAEKQLRGRLTRDPTRTDIAEELGISALEMDRLVSTMTPILSTHAPLAGTDSLTLDDALADESVRDPGDRLAARGGRARGASGPAPGASGGPPASPRAPCTSCSTPSSRGNAPSSRAASDWATSQC